MLNVMVLAVWFLYSWVPTAPIKYCLWDRIVDIRKMSGNLFDWILDLSPCRRKLSTPNKI